MKVYMAISNAGQEYLDALEDFITNNLGSQSELSAISNKCNDLLRFIGTTYFKPDKNVFLCEIKFASDQQIKLDFVYKDDDGICTECGLYLTPTFGGVSIKIPQIKDIQTHDFLVDYFRNLFDQDMD